MLFLLFAQVTQLTTQRLAETKVPALFGAVDTTGIGTWLAIKIVDMSMILISKSP